MCSVVVQTSPLAFVQRNPPPITSHHITHHTTHHTVWNITQEKSTLQHSCVCFFFHFLTADLEQVSLSYTHPLYKSWLSYAHHLSCTTKIEDINNCILHSLLSLSINHPSQRATSFHLLWPLFFVWHVIFVSKESKKARWVNDNGRLPSI